MAGGSGGPSTTRPVAQSREPCPAAQRRIGGMFVPDRDKCGNRIQLRAAGVNIPNDTPTNFQIVDHQRGANVEAFSEMMQQGGARVNWVCQKEDDDWPEPHLHFDVSAADASARSSNEFSFHYYRDWAAQTISSRMSGTATTGGGTFGWTAKYDIEFRHRKVVISTKIKLVNRQGPQPPDGDPLPAIGPAVDDATKNSLKSSIERYLSDKWTFHRDACLRGETCNCPKTRKCCKFQVLVRVYFVESGEYHTVNLYQGTNHTVDASNWARDTWHTQDYAHEVGHLLGWYDEYPEGANGPSPWQSSRAGALMHYSDDGNTSIPRFYYNGFKRHFQTRMGEEWESVSP